MAGSEGEVAQQQQQLLQSIHSMIGELEAEKRSFLAMLDSSQVCSANCQDSCALAAQLCCALLCCDLLCLIVVSW